MSNPRDWAARRGLLRIPPGAKLPTPPLATMSCGGALPLAACFATAPPAACGGLAALASSLSNTCSGSRTPPPDEAPEPPKHAPLEPELASAPAHELPSRP